MSSDVDKILEERGSRYGTFCGHSEITQGVKEVLKGGRSWGSTTPEQREALEMIAHKLGRIVNGDPDYADSWVDIAGYAKLIVDILEGKNP